MEAIPGRSGEDAEGGILMKSSKRCKRCDRIRCEYYVRGLCHPCYNQWWRMNHRTTCRRCRTKVHLHGRHRLCKSCAMLGNRNGTKNKTCRLGSQIISYNIALLRQLQTTNDDSISVVQKSKSDSSLRTQTLSSHPARVSGCANEGCRRRCSLRSGGS